MRIKYALELVLAIAVGLGFLRYRTTGEDYTECYRTRFMRFQDGADSILAGVALVEGLAVLIERVRGKSPSPWGPGRWVWCLAATYLALGMLDLVRDNVAAGLTRTYSSDPLWSDVLECVRGKYGQFLIPSFGWFLLALFLTSMAARRENSAAPDGREWYGRAYAALVVVVLLCFKALTLLGFYQGEMGGGM